MTMATTTANRHLMNFRMSQYDKRVLFSIVCDPEVNLFHNAFSQKPAAVWNL